MTGHEAAKIIRELSSEYSPRNAKRYSEEEAVIMAIRRYAAHELANRCARSTRDPMYVIKDYADELTRGLQLHRHHENAYKLFFEAMSMVIDIQDTLTDVGSYLEAQRERRGLL